MKLKIILLIIFSASLVHGADGVFTNLNATNARFKNMSGANVKSHGAHTGTFSGNVTGIVNGNRINASLFTNLSTALNHTSTIGKTIVVSNAQVSNNITKPADREVEFVFGGTLSGTLKGLKEARPEWFGDNTTPGTTDMKAATDKAIASLVSGGTLLGSPTHYYFASQLTTITKPIVMDFGNAQITAKIQASGQTGPFVLFKGAEFAQHAFNIMSGLNNIITLTTAGDASNYAIGDYVEIRDNHRTDAWDDLNGDGVQDAGSTGTSFGWNGHVEVNRIISINGAAITLMKPTEWVYDTTPLVRKITLINSPKIKNIRQFSEVDPGVSYEGDITLDSAPHIFRFTHCLSPKVDNVAISGFQLHGVNFSRTINPVVSGVYAKQPFRPGLGGHGYLMRFEMSLGGLAENNTGENLRHIVDFNQTYDAKSKNNLALDYVNAPFIAHGLESKRCISEDDTAYSSNTNNGYAWIVGNSAFAGDYNISIVRPTFKGVGTGGILIHAGSKNVQVIDPNIILNSVSDSSAPRGILIQGGAENITISGGSIEYSGSTSILDTNCAIYVRDTKFPDTFSRPVKNITILGVRVVSHSKSSAVAILNAIGSVAIKNLDISGIDDSTVKAVSIISPALGSLVVDGNQIRGVYDNAVYVQTAPTEVYRIHHNTSIGAVGNTIEAAPSSLLRSNFNNLTDLSNLLTINGPAEQPRSINFQTNSVNRWVVRAGNTAETGSDSGSNFEIIPRDDAGNSLSSSLTITRSTGFVSLSKGLDFSSVAAASAPNNSIFRDSADNIIKIKDNTGTVRLLY